MALPTKLVAWNYSLQNRITYTSVVQVMRETMYLIKQRLVAEGWTVRGSSNGVAGAMDGVDRWAAATDAGTRANSSVTPISWFVLRDANNYEVCFAYNSATDDVYRITASFASPFVAAATTTHQPTCTTEQTLNTYYTTVPGTIINSGTSGDRLVSIWTRPDAKGFRVMIVRSGALASVFGLDMHDPSTYGAGITVALSHAFYMNGAFTNLVSSSGMSAATTATGGANTQFRTVTRRIDAALSCDCAHTYEVTRTAALAGGISLDEGMTFAPELQGGAEYMMKRKGLFSITAGARGKVGNNLDWWIGRTTAALGDVYGNREFFVLGPDGLTWAWDGTPSVIGTAVVLS